MDSNDDNNPRTSKQQKRNIILPTREALFSRPQISQNFQQKQYKS